MAKNRMNGPNENIKNNNRKDGLRDKNNTKDNLKDKNNTKENINSNISYDNKGFIEYINKYGTDFTNLLEESCSNPESQMESHLNNFYEDYMSSKSQYVTKSDIESVTDQILKIFKQDGMFKAHAIIDPKRKIQSVVPLAQNDYRLPFLLKDLEFRLKQQLSYIKDIYYAMENKELLSKEFFEEDMLSDFQRISDDAANKTLSSLVLLEKTVETKKTRHKLPKKAGSTATKKTSGKFNDAHETSIEKSDVSLVGDAGSKRFKQNACENISKPDEIFENIVNSAGDIFKRKEDGIDTSSIFKRKEDGIDKSSIFKRREDDINKSSYLSPQEENKDLSDRLELEHLKENKKEINKDEVEEDLKAPCNDDQKISSIDKNSLGNLEIERLDLDEENEAVVSFTEDCIAIQNAEREKLNFQCEAVNEPELDQCFENDVNTIIFSADGTSNTKLNETNTDQLEALQSKPIPANNITLSESGPTAPLKANILNKYLDYEEFNDELLEGCPISPDNSHVSTVNNPTSYIAQIPDPVLNTNSLSNPTSDLVKLPNSVNQTPGISSNLDIDSLRRRNNRITMKKHDKSGLVLFKGPHVRETNTDDKVAESSGKTALNNYIESECINLKMQEMKQEINKPNIADEKANPTLTNDGTEKNLDLKPKDSNNKAKDDKSDNQEFSVRSIFTHYLSKSRF